MEQIKINNAISSFIFLLNILNFYSKIIKFWNVLIQFVREKSCCIFARIPIISNKIKWKEHFNLQEEKEEISMVLEKECQLLLVEKFLHLEELKEEKKFLYHPS